ncbi:peptide deformylase [Roseibacillus ishigakijimensis]|uniref:Peptide deformylase n=1 Tax=Roseibacillus ishigakijimensis TaxID=454146 RepID=A0A934RNL9_9BACT|nr:peptide deformylase [Roseibacillus ishigakijimensis]MBK1834115.1 peptide deformylase [Roseibacillus ishigakijimensis]
MVLEIKQYGDPILRKKCRVVEEVTDEIRELAENMIETMNDAHGVGLAAPQIGEDLRLAVVDVSHDPESITYLKIDDKVAELDEVMPLVFINPELEFGEEKELGREGCLSIQDIQAEVKRPLDVIAKLELLDGRVIKLESDGLLARAIQHEVDHLNGVLFIDRVAPATKLSLKRRLKRLQQGG